jgi:hypothetical protein
MTSLGAGAPGAAEQPARDQGSVYAPGRQKSPNHELEQVIALALDGDPGLLALCGGEAATFRAFTVAQFACSARTRGRRSFPLTAGTIKQPDARRALALRDRRAAATPK